MRFFSRDLFGVELVVASCDVILSLAAFVCLITFLTTRARCPPSIWKLTWMLILLSRLVSILTTNWFCFGHTSTWSLFIANAAGSVIVFLALWSLSSPVPTLVDVHDLEQPLLLQHDSPPYKLEPNLRIV